MQLPPKQTRLWTFYAAISAIVLPNPKNKHIKPLWYRLLLNTVPASATVWDPYVAKNIQQVEMIQRQAARWVVGRYNGLDSVTYMLLKWRSQWSSGDLTHVFVCCTSSVMDEPLGTLRSNDATATRTSLKKVHLRSFSLYRDYSYPITLSNVGELSWSWISRDHIQSQKEK